MHWILQDNLFNESAYEELLRTLERLDISHSIHKVIPFIGELTPEPELPTTNVICMGSYSLRHSAKKYGWNPGVFDLEPFDFTVQKAQWGTHMLNYHSVVTAFEDAVFTAPQMFVRPTEDSKIFAGRVMDREEFELWQKQVCALKLDFNNSLKADTLIQLSPIQRIFTEHRFWIVRGQVVTSSTYKMGRRVTYQPVIEPRFAQYVQDRIAEWQPHEAWVMDVADTPDGIKIVEINTLNSCGFYAADLQKLVCALEQAFSS